MIKVTWQYDVANGDNVQVYKPYSGVRIKSDKQWEKGNGHNGHVRY